MERTKNIYVTRNYKKLKGGGYLYLFIFIFFLLICSLTPISNDDWENFLFLGKNPIKYAMFKYMDWEGRFISRILIVLLTYNKLIWNIISSAINTSIIYLSMKIISPKNKKATFSLLFLVFLLMSFKVFTQSIIWVTGNITYVFVIPLMLGYFYLIMNDLINSNERVILVSILNIIMTMFIEQMAVLLVISNIIILIYSSYKKKKLDKRVLLFLICSLLGTTVMLASPGSANRYINYHKYYKDLSFFNKIIYNIPNFIRLTYIINYYLLALLIIVNFLLIKKYINRMIFRLILYAFLLIMPVFTSLGFLINHFTDNPNIFIDYNNKIICLYYFIHMLITFILLLKEKDEKAIFFYIIGMMSNLIMLLSPTCGNRTAIGAYIFVCISLIIIIDKNVTFNIRKIMWLKLIIIILVLIYDTYYISAYLLHREHLSNINKVISEKSDTLYLQKYPKSLSFLLPIGEDGTKEVYYKKIYNINSNVRIVYTENKWKYYIFYQNS